MNDGSLSSLRSQDAQFSRHLHGWLDSARRRYECDSEAVSRKSTGFSPLLTSRISLERIASASSRVFALASGKTSSLFGFLAVLRVANTTHCGGAFELSR